MPILPDARKAYRFGHSRGQFPAWSGAGAATKAGRWHDKGQDVVYTAGSYALGMLETLAHTNGVMPEGQNYIDIDLPAGLSYEIAPVGGLIGWNSTIPGISREFGAQWFAQQRSLLLFVPSVLTQQAHEADMNIVINPNVAGFDRIRPLLEKPVIWDSRLFQPQL